MSLSTQSTSVSIVTPLYNSSASIAATLDSIRAQTFQNWSSILVDDGSTDNTQQIVEPYLQDPRFRYLKQSNQGIAGARNTGIRSAQGDWVCFLDHDDRWLPTKLERQIAFAMAHNLDICASDATVVQGETRTLYSEIFSQELLQDLERSLSDPTVDVFELLIRGNFICTSSVMIRRTLFDNLGLLNPKAAPADDYDFWLRCMPAAKIGFLNEPLIEYYLHERNYSLDRIRMARKELYALKEARALAKYHRYTRAMDERIAHLSQNSARQCLDRYHEAAQAGLRSEAFTYLRTAFELSPSEVLTPARILAIFKRSLSMLEVRPKR